MKKDEFKTIFSPNVNIALMLNTLKAGAVVEAVGEPFHEAQEHTLPSINDRPNHSWN